MTNATCVAYFVGVDTHKNLNAAVAINITGVHPAATTVPASNRGCATLEAWAKAMRLVQTFGVEGTGLYGAGLSRFLREREHTNVQVNRPNRQLRHQKGKSDVADAASPARAVLAGLAVGQPKSGTDTVEIIYHLKIARDTAVKARTQPMQTIKAIIVCSPDALREQLDQISSKMTLPRRLAALAGSTRDGDRHRGRDAPAGRQQPRAHPLGSSIHQAVRRLPDSDIKRQD